MNILYNILDKITLNNIKTLILNSKLVSIDHNSKTFAIVTNNNELMIKYPNSSINDGLSDVTSFIDDTIMNIHINSRKLYVITRQSIISLHFDTEITSTTIRSIANIDMSSGFNDSLLIRCNENKLLYIEKDETYDCAISDGTRSCVDIFLSTIKIVNGPKALFLLTNEGYIYWSKKMHIEDNIVTFTRFTFRNNSIFSDVYASRTMMFVTTSDNKCYALETDKLNINYTSRLWKRFSIDYPITKIVCYDNNLSVIDTRNNGTMIFNEGNITSVSNIKSVHIIPMIRYIFGIEYVYYFRVYCANNKIMTL